MCIRDSLSPVKKQMEEELSAPSIKNVDDGPLAELCKNKFSELNESLEAIALDSNESEIFRVAIPELVGKISGQSGIKYLILDGIITQRLVDAAKTALGCRDAETRDAKARVTGLEPATSGSTVRCLKMQTLKLKALVTMPTQTPADSPAVRRKRLAFLNRI